MNLSQGEAVVDKRCSAAYTFDPEIHNNVSEVFVGWCIKLPGELRRGHSTDVATVIGLVVGLVRGGR